MNNKQKFLIVCDLDGTLLDDKKNIMEKTASYLKELMRDGNVVALASGRPPRAILPYYEELGLKGPFVSYNGACVYDPNESSFARYDEYYSKEEILSFLSNFKNGEIVRCFAESETKVYYTDHDEEFNSMFNHEGMELVYGPLEKTLDEDVYAFVFQVKEGYEDKVNQTPLSDASLFLRHWYETDKIAEFGSLKRNKASGISKLQSYYHIDRIHTIAFGDAENDVEMLSTAGVPYAMKNASPHLKQIVHNVTLEDNNHEGIYLTLKAFFEGK